MAAKLEVVLEEAGPIRVVVLKGEIDDKSARDLQKTLLKEVAEGRRAVLLDLTALHGIAGAGLRVMVSTAERLEGQGGALAVCCVRPAVEKVMSMAGIDRSLRLYPERMAAALWLQDTVRHQRIARLAHRLLRRGPNAPRPIRRAVADPHRAAAAARLLGVD